MRWMCERIPKVIVLLLLEVMEVLELGDFFSIKAKWAPGGELPPGHKWQSLPVNYGGLWVQTSTTFFFIGLFENVHTE